METQTYSEIKGNLLFHPFAEVLAELAQSRLNGSLRVTHQTNKTIVYVKEGAVVFAVSNQRKHRLFEMLLNAAAITKKQLVEIPEFTNDFALTKALDERGVLPESAMRAVFERQIEDILRDAVVWPEGLWIFSSLARVKEDIHFKVDAGSILHDYARSLTPEQIAKRFKTFNQSFTRHDVPPANINLLPQEAYLLSRFDGSPLRIDEVSMMTGLSDSDTLQRLYVLWLTGYLTRRYPEAAIPEKDVASLMTAKYEVKKQVVVPVAKAPEPEKPAEVVSDEVAETKAELTLETYLEQVEHAETHYETLNISHKSTASEVKLAYFNLAKRYHPDLHHKQTDAATHKRIQNAFTEIAQAYETLRNPDTRTTYDFRLRKILAELEKLTPEERTAVVKPEQKSLTEAAEIFEHGFNLLMEEDFEQAMPYLARAVTMAPEVSRYHAYYGKVLSIDKNQRYKAEAELQLAIKLEPENAANRIMLAEFFVQYNLKKRAEGELNRLLAIVPDNKEAKLLLDSLANK